MRALLDVNVLIALLDQGHVFHDAARDWLVRNIEHGWAVPGAKPEHLVLI
jgi:predicted nucleic acid-binding protein